MRRSIRQTRSTSFGKTSLRAVYLPGGDLPIIGLAVDRMLVDRLVMAIDGESVDALYQGAIKTKKALAKMDSFWLPGKPVPGRMPDFSKALGGK